MKFFVRRTSWGCLIGSAGMLISSANFIIASADDSISNYTGNNVHIRSPLAQQINNKSTTPLPTNI